MKSGLILMFLFLISSQSQFFAQGNQEEKLIYTLRNLEAISPYEDSSLYASRLNQFVFEFTETLQNEDITTFYRFKQLTDSLGFHFQMNQSESSEYALYTFRHRNDYWNYVLKNHEIIYKEEQVFHHFYEIHELKPNEFLLVKLMNQMSYSCYEAFVFNDLNRTKGTKCLTVCSWTNVDESYIAGRDSLTGEPVIIGRMESYDPIPILFNNETKSISYSFVRLSDEKKITRKAKYKRGKFNIESYDAQTEEYP